MCNFVSSKDDDLPLFVAHRRLRVLTAMMCGAVTPGKSFTGISGVLTVGKSCVLIVTQSLNGLYIPFDNFNEALS